MSFIPAKSDKNSTPFFTHRDRIAIACISALILVGWGARLFLLPKAKEDVRLIHHAVSPPALLGDSTFTAKKTGEPLLVNINTADSRILETLPMIGPSKAKEIIKYREEHGRFLKSSDIMRVKGIGPSTYEKIEKRITIGSP